MKIRTLKKNGKSGVLFVLCELCCVVWCVFTVCDAWCGMRGVCCVVWVFWGGVLQMVCALWHVVQCVVLDMYFVCAVVRAQFVVCGMWCGVFGVRGVWSRLVQTSPSSLSLSLLRGKLFFTVQCTQDLLYTWYTVHIVVVAVAIQRLVIGLRENVQPMGAGYYTNTITDT